MFQIHKCSRLFSRIVRIYEYCSTLEEVSITL
jgi:hypothetical protein